MSDKNFFETECQKIRLAADMMEPSDLNVLAYALKCFFGDHIKNTWAKENNIKLKDVKVVIRALDRIGSTSGTSGSSVFIVEYTQNIEKPDTRPSCPYVVKLGTHKKLKDEMCDKIFPKKEFRPRFAIPIELYPKTKSKEYSKYVLIAPFRADFKMDLSATHNKINKVKDLYSLLDGDNNTENWTKIRKYLDETFLYMMDVHRNAMPSFERYRRNVNLGTVYQRYLRKTVSYGTVHGKKAVLLKLDQLFGTNAETIFGGRRFNNPNNVIKTAVNYTCEQVFGFVHGDLHPKNIVIGRDDSVNIIDFGWVNRNAPIVIDYILMDISIRATTLPVYILNSEAMDIAGFLHPNQDLPKNNKNTVFNRAQLIKKYIWQPLLDEGVVTIDNWYREYLVPFFIIAYGLLVYLPSFSNQSALIATVLAACERLTVKVKGKSIL